jgi:8-oxo-dGTP diphosphatase
MSEDMAPYCYDYPRPAVAADVAVFALRDEKLSILLIKRKRGPFAGKWALPGGFLEEHETLNECAQRELREETGIGATNIYHFGNFSAPNRDPRGRVISVAYFVFVSSERSDLRAGSDASAAAWWDTSDLPELAFDHSKIIDEAIKSLCKKHNALRRYCS